MKKALFLVAALMAVTIQLSGKITLPSIISDNMVLQQKASVKLWGWAEPGEEVTIIPSWGKRGHSVQAGTDGRWEARINTPAHCIGQSVEFISGRTGEKLKVENILIGEVWLASGQSNMEFEMKPHQKDKWMTGMYDWEKEAADANYPGIHLFKVEEDWEHNTPRKECKGEWVVCSPEVVQTYSAIAFLFARGLHRELQMPVGVILCAFGGTHAESWIRDEVMRQDSIYNRVYKNYTPEITAPKGYQHKVPAAIWNAMVNPILGYTIKGNIWYQAESNAWRAEDYAPIFTQLVNDWRSLWGQKRLPFYFMQVAPFADLPGKIRMEQAKVWEGKMLEDIGMPTAIDVGDSLDIHPKNKIVPARRFLQWALAKEYGKAIECEGPIFKEMKIKDGKAIITFRNSKGLHLGNILPDNSVEPAGPQEMARYLHIAGADGVFHPALSRIEGEKLVVWSPEVPKPAKVKYCQEDYCKGNIYNGAGLPAYPFAISM